MEQLLEYIEGVKEKRYIVGDTMLKAVQRCERDLKNPVFEYRSDVVKHAVNFISTLEHYTGEHDGNKFELEPWQYFVIANVIGFYYKGTDIRRFKDSYIEVSRKNGKTALSAALCLYFLIADGESGAEVLLAANSKEQARIAFDIVRGFTKRLDTKFKYLKPQHSKLLFPITNSQLKVLASDDSKLDGYNASFALIDEYHAAPNSRVRDVLKSSMGMRKNPHLMTITTAGFDKGSVCYHLRTTGIEVVNGVKTDESMFVAIFSLDDGDDWTSKEVWIKSNPNLGVTVKESFIQEQVQKAMNNPSDEVGVRTKNLNQWMDSETTWIPDKYILSSTVDNVEYYNDELFIGVDLASTSDLTAVAFLKVVDDKYFFKVNYYLPESALHEKTDKIMYRDWRRLGLLNVTAGNVTDYNYITNDIVTYGRTNTIRSISYDAYNSTQWAIDATELGLPLITYSQTIGSFNKPTKELERLILSGKVFIDNNEITRYCFRNVVLKYDYNQNVKPNKNTDKNKIDGVIAMIMALASYLESPKYKNEIFIM